MKIYKGRAAFFFSFEISDPPFYTEAMLTMWIKGYDYPCFDKVAGQIYKRNFRYYDFFVYCPGNVLKIRKVVKIMFMNN